MKPIYISIGTQCTALGVLTEMYIRGKSLPFDWRFSTPEFVYTILRLLLVDNAEIDYIVDSHFFACDKKASLDTQEHYSIDPDGSALFNSKYRVCFPHRLSSPEDPVSERDKYITRLIRLKELLLDKNNFIYLIYVSLCSYSGLGNYTIDNEDVIKDLYQYIHKIDVLLKNIMVDNYKILVFDVAEVKENKIESDTTLYIDLQPSSDIVSDVKEKMYSLFDTEQIHFIVNKYAQTE